MAIARQRPTNANGVVFMLLEDEHAQMNLIIPPPVYKRYRPIVRGEPLLLARGKFERRDRNQNVLVRELETLAPLARRVAEMDVDGALRAPTTSGTVRDLRSRARTAATASARRG